MMHLYLCINDREIRRANQEIPETLGTMHRTELRQTKQSHNTENLTDEQQRHLPNKTGVRPSAKSKFMISTNGTYPWSFVAHIFSLKRLISSYF